MRETLNRWMKLAATKWGELSPRKKIAVSVIGALLAVGGGSLYLIAKQDPHQILYSDLQPEDSRAVAKKLSDQRIPYQVSEEGGTISVPRSRVYEARMELAKDGIPGHDVVGFEKFDGSTIGMSSYVQRIQYVRAVQGELVRSIQRLASVKRARVHISLPPRKTFMEDEEPPKASVVLELKSGQAPSKSEVHGIAHLVASAVEGLKVNQVTIVDTKGSFLHRPEDSGALGVPNGLLEAQRALEVELENRVEDILSPVVGTEKVRAKVTVEIDPSRVNTTEESFEADKAVPRTVSKTDEINSGSRPNPIGIPGSRSNLPGTEVQNPPVPVATMTNEKNVQNTNFSIPRKIQITDKPSGSIKRLTVAVVVDGYYTKGAGQAADAFTPRTEEELKRIQDLVGNAVGYDPQRRDSITVTSVPFKTADLMPEEEKKPDPFSLEQLKQHGIRNGVIGLLILTFFFLILRPFLKWFSKSDLEREVSILPKTVAEIEAEIESGKDVLALNNGSTEPEVSPLTPEQRLEQERVARVKALFDDEEPIEKDEQEELKRRIQDKLKNAPKKGIRIVQEWLGDSTEPVEA